MNAHETLPVYVVPSAWTRRNCAPTHLPYQRVVGVQTNNQRRVWVPRRHREDPSANYSRFDAEEVLLPSNAVFTERLLGFFTLYMTSNSQRILKNEPRRYNCHSFARWMVGHISANSSPTSRFVANDSPDELIRESCLVVPPIEHGQRGFIGPHHSFIGLGEGSDDCLQVLAANGHMGIQSYDALLKDYRGQRLYVPAVAEPAA